MAYNSVTFSKLKANYNIDPLNKDLFVNYSIENIDPSTLLIESLKYSERMPIDSEKAKSEVLIFPIIRELVRRNENISVFSGYTFNIKG